MGLQPLSDHRRVVVVSTILGKCTKLVFGAVVVYALYEAGVEGLAYAFVFGGGGYALVRTISDWRNGRKPWLPVERVPADDFQDSPYQRSAILGTVLGKLGTIALGCYLVYVLYQAGLTTLTYAFVFGGGGYALVRTISDWRNGHKPWYPSKRVQRLE